MIALIYHNKNSGGYKDLTYKSSSTMVNTNMVIKHEKKNTIKKSTNIVLIDDCIDQIQDKSMIEYYQVSSSVLCQVSLNNSGQQSSKALVPITTKVSIYISFKRADKIPFKNYKRISVKGTYRILNQCIHKILEPSIKKASK